MDDCIEGRLDELAGKAGRRAGGVWLQISSVYVLSTHLDHIIRELFEDWRCRMPTRRDDLLLVTLGGDDEPMMRSWESRAHNMGIPLLGHI